MFIYQAFLSCKRPCKLLLMVYNIIHVFKKSTFNKPGETVGLFGFMLFHRPGFMTSSGIFSPEVHFEHNLLVALRMNAERAKPGYRKDN